jgi:hypothetical protein
MRFALQAHGDIRGDMLSDSASDLDLWKFYVDDGITLEFVPPAVRQNMTTNKSLRQGLAQLCQHFAKCVEKGQIPNEENVLRVWRHSSEWPPVTRNFLERGGTVASVASMLFSHAMVEDLAAGELSFHDTFEAEIDKLPQCRNDCEFGFASSMLGYERVGRIKHVCALTGRPLDIEAEPFMMRAPACLQQ